MWRALRNMLTGSALLQRASELAARVAALLPAALPHGEEVRDAPHVQCIHVCLWLNGAHSDQASCSEVTWLRPSGQVMAQLVGKSRKIIVIRGQQLIKVVAALPPVRSERTKGGGSRKIECNSHPMEGILHTHLGRASAASQV